MRRKSLNSQNRNVRGGMTIFIARATLPLRQDRFVH